jgi:hypothetical protein
MKLLVLVMLLPGTVWAHTSTVPHAHPHDASMLSDILILGAGVLLFAIANLVLRRMR